MGITTKQKIAGIYDPYIDTLGGGEKYVFTIAQILLERGYRIDVFTNLNKTILEKLQNRFNLNLSTAQIKPDIFKKHGFLSTLNKYNITKKYDLFFYLNDGSIPLLFSKHNILHIQVPFNKTPNLFQKLINSIKLILFKDIIVNSKFTQARVKQIYLKNSQLLYPPIDITNFTPAKTKQNIILSVGRFDNILNAKRQDILINAFKKLYIKNHLSGWKLILAGSSLENESTNLYLSHLKFTAKDLPIEFVVNQPFDTIKKLFSISKIYWHAAGFGVDEKTDPQSTEHFGMTVVESMAAGLVPVVINKGGLKEIINQNINGFVWNKIDQLVGKTQLLISHPLKYKQMSQNARNTSTKYSTQNFKNQFIKIIS